MRTSLLVFIVTFALFQCGTTTSYAQEIGLQLYSLRNEFPRDVPGTFAKIKSWGITNLEDGNDGTYGYTQEEYNALLAENGLQIVSVSAPFEELESSPETVVARAKNYGAKYAVCFWIPHENNDFTLSDTNRALAVFNAAGKLLQEHGITLTYHPHGYEFKPHKEGFLLDHLIQGSDHFDFEMDVYWFAHPGEDPVAWLRKYPEEFKLMHLKDCKKGTKGNREGRSDVETNVILGTGQIDIAAVVAEARKLGIAYLFVEDESSKSLSQLPESIKFLKRPE